MRFARRLALASLLASACAHEPPRPVHAPSAERAVWPPPPAPPLARLALILPAPGAPPPARPWWQVLLSWITGGTVGGSDEAALVRPFGVDVSADRTLYVADPDAGALFRLRDGEPLRALRCKGMAWGSPMAVAATGDGALLVADAGLAAVVRMRGDECSLLGEGAFERPTGIAISDGRILVADPPRHQIVVLDPAGKVAARWGEQGPGEGQFAFPTSIARAPDGSLLVADALNFRVVRLDPEGRWLAAFGAPGDEGAGFSRPKGIAADATGRVFVSDAQRDKILAFTAAGEPAFAIGESGEAPGQLALPSGLAVEGNRLYVADSQNRRIQVFELLGGTP